MADNQNENNNYEQIIEAILFAAGRVVAEQELMIALEMSQEKIENIINKMQIFTITAYNADYILAKEENFQKL